MTTTQYTNALPYFDERKARYAHKALRADRRFFLKNGFFYTGAVDDFWGFF